MQAARRMANDLSPDGQDLLERAAMALHHQNLERRRAQGFHPPTECLKAQAGKPCDRCLPTAVPWRDLEDEVRRGLVEHFRPADRQYRTLRGVRILVDGLDAADRATLSRVLLGDEIGRMRTGLDEQATRLERAARAMRTASGDNVAADALAEAAAALRALAAP